MRNPEKNGAARAPRTASGSPQDTEHSFPSFLAELQELALLQQLQLIDFRNCANGPRAAKIIKCRSDLRITLPNVLVQLQVPLVEGFTISRCDLAALAKNALAEPFKRSRLQLSEDFQSCSLMGIPVITHAMGVLFPKMHHS